MALTDDVIATSKFRAKPWKLADTRGLYLLMTPAWTKLWRLKYRIDGREKLLALGAYPDVDLEEARKLRDEARALIALGKDPLLERQRAKARARMLAAADTFQVMSDEYCAKRRSAASKGWTPEAAARNEYLLGLVCAVIGRLVLAEIEPSDVLMVIRRIERKENLENARDSLQLVRDVFRHAVATSRLAADPTRDLHGAQPWRSR